jgi:hypothetical protein
MLIKAGALDKLFARLGQSIKDAGYLPMSGQIVDASLVAAPRQRNTEKEKSAIKAGKTSREIWPDKPAKAAQKDTDARWTVKTKGKVEADGTVKRDLAIPEFGYKSHIGIDERHGFIRRQKVTDAAAHDGARLREGLLAATNTASDALRGLLAASLSGIGSKASWPSMGRNRLPLESRRGLLQRSRQAQPDPPAKTRRQADAEANGQGQCQEVQGSGDGRACLRPAEGSDEARDPQSG